MALMPLHYPPDIESYVNQKLQGKPGLEIFLRRLEDSIRANPKQASPEIIVLDNGKKISCRRKSVRANSYSKNMIFSKDEIIVLYKVMEKCIRVIAVYFPTA